MLSLHKVFIFSYLLELVLMILFLDGKTTRVAAMIVPDEKIVDTNGAGDAFVGGRF